MELKIGGKYNFRGQATRLVYLGRNWIGNGFWHQFARVERPDLVWSEILDSDLHMIVETPAPEAPDTDRLTKAVIRQALIEYVNARAPYIFNYDDPTEARVREHLEDYVRSLSVRQTEAFRDQQMERIAPRVMAAIAEIQHLGLM